ncbi:hypothetical protein SAMN05421505_1767 [Sinosporangium album]|uniref:CU044_5270 family protein n=1 Tax=Sinosporangium album TaxID=504805 RepID=A0A1G8LRX1_9ACTN|nr:hypothetical protein [Sinosporangium album]SDI58365.1 hypothetical protein SAMN05421505_1767 [Sinosporangium album]
MKTTDEIDEQFAAMRPAGLDKVTAESHHRRRNADITRAFREPQTAVRRRTAARPRLVVAGLAVAALAVGAVVLPDAIGGSGAETPHSTVAAPPAAHLDARSFLLASAATAERATETEGAYWYTSVRTFEPIRHAWPDSEAGQEQKGKREKLPYRASVAHTQESWTARSGGARSRTITGQDVKVTFGTPADETAWKKAGEPKLWPFTRAVNDNDMPIKWTVGAHGMSTDELRKLPQEEAELLAELQRLHKTERPEDWATPPSFNDYVWWTAADLLAGPLTPETRGALYRVLAQQDGMQVERVKDPLGRAGVAISHTTDEGNLTARLTVNESSSELLAYESQADGAAEPLVMAYQAMGWADSIDTRPGG